MTMIQNISQTVPILAILFLKNRPDNAHIHDLQVVASAKDKESAAELREKLKRELSPETLKECQRLGVELPCDPIEITVELGSFLFDIYINQVTEPEPPLLKTIWKKRNLYLADLFDKTEFKLEDLKFAIDPIKSTLLDSEKWKKVTITGWYKINDNKYAISMNSVGILQFPKILEAAGEMFYQEEV